MDVVSLERYRLAAARRRPAARRGGLRPTFYFDVQSPYTYLAAERADRMFAGLQWLPASSSALSGGVVTCEIERAAISKRAELLGLPLVWPVDPPVAGPSAMRVASLAAERGVGAEFVLAASRLVFCGGYGTDDPETLAEAAAAAGMDWREMLEAVGDGERDVAIEEAGRRLIAAGADRLPALRVGRMLFCGEDRLGEAAAARRSA
jgi:2-hydroxychromene-2-carboxylate isomerase